MKKIHIYIIAAVAALATATACHPYEEFEDNPLGNFDALWTALDEHYCFFGYKDVDWDEVGERYRTQILDEMSSSELFDVCAAMLEELQDGHVNLISSWDVSHYWIWENYPQNYDERLVNEYYLNFDYRTASGIKYQILSNNYGYMQYASFSDGIGEGNLDNVLSYLAASDGLIIDVRDNGGGYLSNVETLVARFITEDIYAGSISHKTGPGHDDFSDPYDYYFGPASSDRIKYLKPVVILTNRSSFSATNNFVSIMQYVPNVKIVGDSTGGGSGLPFTSEIPIGWTVRFSACSIRDAEGNETEFGVAPSEGCRVDMDEEDALEGRDTILETAFEVLSSMISSL